MISLLTPVWSPIGSNIAKLDDMFLVQPQNKGLEAISSDLADG